MGEKVILREQVKELFNKKYGKVYSSVFERMSVLFHILVLYTYSRVMSSYLKVRLWAWTDQF